MLRLLKVKKNDFLLSLLSSYADNSKFTNTCIFHVHQNQNQLINFKNTLD